NPEWSVMLLAWLIACCATVALYFAKRGAEQQSRWPVALLLLVWAMFVVDFRQAATRSTQSNAIDATAITCLGDSLTDYGYPEELQKLIRSPVLDYGFDGITSADGLELIEEILAKNPRLVVLELGGHDYNQRRARKETLDNMSQIIQRCRDNDVDVLLVEIPRGFVRDPFRGMERQLARQFDLELISDTLIRQFVLYSPICPPGSWLPPDQHLSRDGLHPNENGNRLFAQTVASKLAKLLGDEILIDLD
ncbi:MAG: GDSL-type esterase/lipase family protein, partial [Pirellulaceae bacterium]